MMISEVRTCRALVPCFFHPLIDSSRSPVFLRFKSAVAWDSRNQVEASAWPPRTAEAKLVPLLPAATVNLIWTDAPQNALPRSDIPRVSIRWPTIRQRKAHIGIKNGEAFSFRNSIQ